MHIFFNLYFSLNLSIAVLLTLELQKQMIPPCGIHKVDRILSACGCFIGKSVCVCVCVRVPVCVFGGPDLEDHPSDSGSSLSCGHEATRGQTS